MTRTEPILVQTAQRVNLGDPQMLDKAIERQVVLIAHENPRTARFLEGILRNGFKTEVAMNCVDAMKILACAPPDLILCDIKSLMNEESRLLETMEQNFDSFQIPLIVVSDDREEDYQELVKVRNGPVDYVQESVHPRVLRWKVRNWLHMRQRVHELAHSESQARRSCQRLKTQMENLAHDLKSPVVALRGYLKSLTKQILSKISDSGAEDTLRRLDDISRSIEDLVEDSQMVAAGTAAQDNKETIRLDEMANELVIRYQHLIEDKRIDVKVTTRDPLPTIYGRRPQIRQVLDNLLVNAIIHMGMGGRSEIRITIVENGTSVITHVADNGVGIPFEYQDRVFERLFRVPGANRGTGGGLGLSIVKEILERHKGKIWLTSTPGKGSTFSFSLPKRSG